MFPGKPIEIEDGPAFVIDKVSNGDDKEKEHIKDTVSIKSTVKEKEIKVPDKEED
jgi:hypothetical protein